MCGARGGVRCPRARLQASMRAAHLADDVDEKVGERQQPAPAAGQHLRRPQGTSAPQAHKGGRTHVPWPVSTRPSRRNAHLAQGVEDGGARRRVGALGGGGLGPLFGVAKAGRRRAVPAGVVAAQAPRARREVCGLRGGARRRRRRISPARDREAVRSVLVVSQLVVSGTAAARGTAGAAPRAPDHQDGERGDEERRQARQRHAIPPPKVRRQAACATPPGPKHHAARDDLQAHSWPTLAYIKRCKGERGLTNHERRGKAAEVGAHVPQPPERAALLAGEPPREQLRRRRRANAL